MLYYKTKKETGVEVRLGTQYLGTFKDEADADAFIASHQSQPDSLKKMNG